MSAMRSSSSCARNPSRLSEASAALSRTRPVDPAREGEIYKQVLSLLLAQRRPSYYLLDGRAELSVLADQYLRLLWENGVIDAELLDAALAAELRFLKEPPAPEPISFISQKASAAIRTELLQSRRFRFVADPHGQDEIGEQVRFQQESGRVNPEMAKKFGKQLGADVVIYGALRSIEKRTGRSLESGGTKFEDVYYQFVLNCVNLETGEIIWSDKGEIRKTQRTGVFG